jgi:hypothetical protein
MQREDFYHHCFALDDIREGDLIPVGGGMIGSAAAPWSVKADFQAIYPAFAETAERNAEQFKTPAWQDWFKTTLPDIDPALATTLQTFTTAFETRRQQQSVNSLARKKLYEDADKYCVALSQVFDARQAMCVEMALLAKKFLDEKGIKSRFFSGEALFHYIPGEANTPEPHSFLLIEHGGHEYIFDPANPTLSQNGNVLFSLLKPCRSFSACGEKMKSDCFMIAAENMLTQQCQYYGVGDCGNVPERLFVHGEISEKIRGNDTAASGISAQL